MGSRNKTRLVDCDTGRCMGCATFCCRMLVRLQLDEIKPGDGTSPPKSFVDKDTDGYCIHFDRESNHCNNWEERPKVCREYECNSDFLLQVVLREGFSNIANLAKAASKAYIPKESYIKIPMMNNHPRENDNAD